MTFEQDAGALEAVRRELRKFTPLPVHEGRRSGEAPVPVSQGGGGSVGAFIHLSRNATQSISSSGELISWDTEGLNGFSGFSVTVSTTTVTIPQDGYYNIGIQFGWSSFTGGGTMTVQRNGTTVWPPTDDPGLWSATDGQEFEGTAHSISCVSGDTIGVHINPDDASAQTLASATLAVYLVDRTADESGYRALVISDGPIAYWRLDETAGTNAADETGTHDATYTNSPDLAQSGVMDDGSGNLSVNFDGTKHVLGVDWAALEFSGTASFSLEAWFNTDTVAAESAVIIHKQVSGSGDGWELIRNGAAVHVSRVGASSHNAEGGTVVVGTDHYVVATYDGTTLRLYLDNVEVDTDATAVTMNTSTVLVSIGYDAASAGAVFDGRIDEVAVYDRELTVAEIGEHYAMGTRG